METIPVELEMKPLGHGMDAILARLEAQVFTREAGLPAITERKFLQTRFGSVKPDETPTWLKDWTPSDSFVNVPVEVILQEIKKMDECTLPSGDKAAAVVIDKALNQFGTPDNWEALADDYLDELSQVPPDLLNEIWVYCRRECEFMPKISKMLQPVKDKILARSIKKTKLQVMLGYARR